MWSTDMSLKREVGAPMIERVTSKVLPGIVTHVIVKIAEPTSGKSKRQDFCDPANPLQVAEIPLPKG